MASTQNLSREITITAGMVNEGSGRDLLNETEFIVRAAAGTSSTLASDKKEQRAHVNARNNDSEASGNGPS